MKNIRKLVLTGVNLLLLTSSINLYAGNQAEAVSLTLGGGELFLSSKRNMDNAGVPLLILGYNFTDRWGIEGMLGTYTTEYKHNQPTDQNIDGTIVAVNGVYRFDTYRSIVEPFVLFGVGAIGMNPNNNDANNEGNINFGIGAEVFFHKAVALRVEARDFYTWVGGKNDVMVDAGVTFLFNIC